MAPLVASAMCRMTAEPHKTLFAASKYHRKPRGEALGQWLQRVSEGRHALLLDEEACSRVPVPAAEQMGETPGSRM